jgi:hypothetical protein
MADSQDGFASEGLRFLKEWATEKNNIQHHTILKSSVNGE